LQSHTTHIIWIISLGSSVVLIFALAYIAIVVSSSRRVIDAQRAKVAEVTKSAERYKALFDHSLAGMMKFSPDLWRVNEANASLLAMFGCSSNEEMNKSFSQIAGPTRDFIIRTLVDAGIVLGCEIKSKRKDGSDIWILFSAKQVQGDSLVHGVVIDITKRKMIEAKVAEQAALLDETQDAIIVMGENGKISFWNRGAEATYGWDAAEVIGTSLPSLLYTSEKEETYRVVLEHVVMHNEWSGETKHRTRDGRELLVESRWRVVQHASNGHKTILIVNTDITAKKRMEAQFIKTQKMESIALLTGGIAHDLQNILAPVAMSIGLLRGELKDETTLTVLRAVEESAQSGLQLVKNILTYGKGIAGDYSVINVADILRQVLSIVERNMSSSIVVDEDILDTAWLVRGDVSQLKQVFLNILVNARDAMQSGGVLGIKIEDSLLDEGDRVNYPESRPGRYVAVSISDSGMGIDEEYLDRIFEPFFTTKEGGEGTGLGLSIVLGIVKSHNGFITVDSIVGRGTTFRVYLPHLGEAEI